MTGRNIVIGLLLTGLVAGCASVRVEMPPDSVRHHEQSTARLLSEGIGIVGDGCIAGIAMAGSVAYQDESIDYIGVALTRFGKFLATQGIMVRRQVLPLLCGQLIVGAAPVRVAEDADSADQLVTPPVIVSEQLRHTPRLALAYAELLGAAAKVGPTAITQPAAEIEVPLDLSSDTASALRQELGSPLVLVASVRGSQVSGPRKWATAIATGVASLAISGGTFVQISSNQSFTAHSLVLVDLDRRKAMWKTEIVAPRIDPLDPFYRKQHMRFWDGMMARPFLRTPPVGAAMANVDAIPPAVATEAAGSTRTTAPSAVEMTATKGQLPPSSAAARRGGRRATLAGVSAASNPRAPAAGKAGQPPKVATE